LKLQNISPFRNHVTVQASLLVLVQSKKFMLAILNMKIEVLRYVFLNIVVPQISLVVTLNSNLN
jgi:hypothetical protein